MLALRRVWQVEGAAQTPLSSPAHQRSILMRGGPKNRPTALHCLRSTLEPWRVHRRGGTYETYGLGDIVSAFKVKPDTGPPFAEVRV
jgi:hypothetical protein